MANVEKTFPQATGKVLYCFPEERYALSFSAWSGTRALATESAAPNLGRYTVTLDDTYRYWLVFEGSATPADWDQWIDKIDIYSGVIRAEDLDTSAIVKINQHRS